MLAYLFLSKVATLTQSNLLSAIYRYVHLCLITDQEHWHGSICWHSSIRGNSSIRAGIAIFARLQRLNVITIAVIITHERSW